MRTRISALCALLVASFAPGAFAQQTAPEVETLRLTLDDAVERALQSNVDIAVARYDPQISAENVRIAEGYYDPLFFANLDHSSTDTKGTNVFAGGDTINNKQDLWNFGIQAPIKTGADLELRFNNNRRDTDNAFVTFNPTYNSFLSVGITQPLLRNFKIDAPRQTLRLAKINRELSDIDFRQGIINTVADVKFRYYDLIYAIDNLEASRKSLELARKLLDENEIRVKVGTMAPLDVVTARSEVASREEGVIVAENAVAQAEDDLKRLIFPENDPAMWNTRLVLLERPSAAPMPVNINGAVQSALENRTDVVSARKALERSDTTLSFRKNQLLPSVNLTASYGGSGAGGPEIIRDPPLDGPVVETIPGGYSDALDEVFGRDFPTWSIGVNFSYSVPNRTIKAAAAQAQLSKDQALAGLRRLELQVAAEVRTAGRAVESGTKRVAATKAARELAAERLDAEEKKFAAGMSTNYLVTQAQRDLAVAEVNELQAIADYAKSVVNFQRVQEAGVGGTGAVAIVGGGTTSQGSQALLSGSAASSVNQSTSGGLQF